MKNEMKRYNAVMFLISIVGIIVAFTTPEIRKYLGLDKAYVESVPAQPISIENEVKQEKTATGLAKNELPNNPKNNQSVDQLPTTTIESKSRKYYPESKTVESKEEDYSSYINAPIKRSNVSVIVVDSNGNILTHASTTIVDIYKKTGKNASMGLLKSSFTKKQEFQELYEGNSEIIQNLKISLYVDYLALGRVSYTKRSGNLVDGTFVCTASISMSIISTSSKSLEKSFVISNVSGNGVTESQAQENALQRLFDKYQNGYSSL